MFHLLVKYHGWQPNHDTLDDNRIFEYTDKQIADEFKPNGKMELEKISSIPAIFVSETQGSGEQIARIGQIHNVETNKGEVAIHYSLEPNIPPITNPMLEKLADKLQINEFEFSRTHWAIKEANLYQILLGHHASTKYYPKVFSLPEAPISQPDISVMMPFDSVLNSVYEILQQTAKSLNLTCIRADDIWEHDAVIQDVVSLICNSQIVVCDCTGRNANVFYEIGIAHALGKNVILITQAKGDIPFDLQHLKYLEYLNNDEGRNKLSASITRRIKTLIK